MNGLNLKKEGVQVTSLGTAVQDLVVQAEIGLFAD
jgi:hypothetical protein